jgi:hypothetical protein
LILIQKRIKIFETNSSSTHSIVVNSKDISKLNNTLHTLHTSDNKSYVIVECNEFGWGVDQYTDAKMKLSYLVTYICSRISHDNIKKIKDTSILNKDIIIKNNLLETQYIELFTKLENIICKFCNCDELKIKFDADDYFPFGYIDHQSTAVPLKMLHSDDDYIIDYIFNPNSTLCIDNDNHI